MSAVVLAHATCTAEAGALSTQKSASCHRQTRQVRTLPTNDGDSDPNTQVFGRRLARARNACPTSPLACAAAPRYSCVFVCLERLFSRAGRMHDDLRSAMSDGTLQHALFAALNTE